MLIHNPFIGHDKPLKLLALSSAGTQSPMQVISRPTLEVPDDTVELLIECDFRGAKLVKVWTKAHGIMELDEYQSRRQLAEERAEFEKERSRRRQPRETKEQPQNENDPPASN